MSSYPLPQWNYAIKEDLVISCDVRQLIADMPLDSVAMGVCIFSFGSVPPKWNLSCPLSNLYGSVVRLSRRVEFADDDVAREFARFSRDFIQGRELDLAQLSCDVDISVDTWLSQCKSYSQSEKEAIRLSAIPLEELYQSCRRFVRWRARCRARRRWPRKIPLEFLPFIVKRFGKEEFYAAEVLKVLRGINARPNVWKAFMGPLIKFLEHLVYDHPAFVKKVPVTKRAEYIKFILEVVGDCYAGTDYSSFESMFHRAIMLCTSVALYRFMFQHLPGSAAIIYILEEILAGDNVIFCKWFRIIIEATRQSGEMDTSFANGLVNLIFMSFIMVLVREDELQDAFLRRETMGLYEKRERRVVEGDDGAAGCRGRLPTPADFARLGFVVTDDYSSNPLHLAFCGIRAAEDMTNIRDVRKVLATFPFLPRRYVRAKVHMLKTLYRAKALSLLVESRNCPVLHSFARAIVRLTRAQHNRVKKVIHNLFDAYHRDIAYEGLEKYGNNVPDPIIGFETRLRCEEWFNISVEKQLELERHFDMCSWDTIGNIDLDFPALWTLYHRDFVKDDLVCGMREFPCTSANVDQYTRCMNLVSDGPEQRAAIHALRERVFH